MKDDRIEDTERLSALTIPTRSQPELSGFDSVPNCAHDCDREGL